MEFIQCCAGCTGLLFVGSCRRIGVFRVADGLSTSLIWILIKLEKQQRQKEGIGISRSHFLIMSTEVDGDVW